jgi:hypothetical protein
MVIAGELHASCVCRTGEELLGTQEEWKAALESKGWSSSA